MEIVAVFAAAALTWCLLYWAVSSIYYCIYARQKQVETFEDQIYDGCQTTILLLATGLVSVGLVACFLVWFWLS